MTTARLTLIDGCGAYGELALDLELTAPADRAIATVTLADVHFVGLDEYAGLALDAAPTEALPLAADASTPLSFFYEFELGLATGHKFDDEREDVRVDLGLVIDGERADVSFVRGEFRYGIDEPPIGGC